MVAYVVAVASLTLLLGNPVVADTLFTDQAGQSEKVLSVWTEQEPLPAVTPFWDDLDQIDARGLVVQGILLVWASALVLVYALGWSGRPGGPIWRGLGFGVAMWAVLFLYEALVLRSVYPLNLLGEPFRLVLSQLALTLVAMIVTGVVIALMYRPRPESG